MKMTLYAAIITYPNGRQKIGTTSDSRIGADAYCKSYNYLGPMPTDPKAHVERFVVDLKPKRKSRKAAAA